MSATLIFGDCLEKMKSLPDKSVDCFICDLPYGQLTGGGGQEKKKRTASKLKRAEPDKEHISRNANVYETGGCTWDVKIDLEKFWEQVERLARNDAVPVIHFCNTKFGIDLINSKPDWFRYDLVWNKERGVSFLLANKMPMKSHEMIYVFSKKGAYYNRIDDIVEGKKAYISNSETGGKRQYGNIETTVREQKDGSRCSLSVITFKKVGTIKDTHPTEKPQALYEWLLRRYCPPGGTVLDPTAGSFNSVLVARRLGFDAIGVEMDEGFYNKGVEKFLEEPEEL
jgi:site-specific DNA-methyltransferase (adenine-specific)